MGKEDGTFCEVGETGEGFFVREDFGGFALLDDRVHDVAEHGWNLALCLYVHHESAKDFLATDAHGGNLYDVVTESVETCCFGIKNDYVLRLVCLYELLCERWCAYGHKLGRRYACGYELMHDVSCLVCRMDTFRTLHDARPCYEVGV